MTYHDDNAGSDVGTYSGIGYIGGVASDLSSSSGSAPATAQARAAAAPAAAGTTTGVPVLQITKLQYAYGTSGTFADVTNPIYVDAGTTVVFKAIPSTPGAAFPAGQPQWSGVKGTASGDTYTVLFTTLNKTTTPADYQTVTATFGTSTVTANVVVQGVTITTGALADTDPSASAPTPLLKRVNVNGTDYGSGTTLSLTVTPVNGFKGKVKLDIDVNSAKADVFGLTGAGQDSSGAKVHYSFYNPVDRDGHLYVDKPSYFTLDCTDQKPKTIILTLTNGGNKSPFVAAGGYKVIVFANPNDQGNTRMGNELSLPVTVVKYTAPPSASFTGGANDGLYKAGRTYDSDTSKTKTGYYYDALSGMITLPPTSPDSTSLVQDYNTGDAFDIYSGGVARDPTTGLADAIDIGLNLGHTGNSMYAPTGNYPLYPKNQLSNAGDQIQPGLITFTFEAPGYVDPILGKVLDNTAYLIVQGGKISGTKTYNFTHLPPRWVSGYNISIKHITSIAQKDRSKDPTMTGASAYNAPPTPYTSPDVKNPFFYTSGSKVPYVAWSGLQVHVQGPTSGMTPITLPADESSAGSPYVTSGSLRTCP